MLALLSSLSDDLAAVGAQMTRALATSEPRVAQLLEELGEFHGKMLRPALVLLVARALGGVAEEHRLLGAALEMIHTATLIHDDLIDEGEQRRGLPTAHVRFGTSTAVLLGDFFYTRAFDLVARQAQPDKFQRLTSTTNIICEGELHQMCARRDLTLSEAEYDRIIHAKTAALCATACWFGASAGSAEQQSASAEFGRRCGMAFQIVDDCLDLAGDAAKVGKTLATDIERGRMTLPVLRLLAATPAGPARDTLGQRLLAVRDAADVDAVRRLVLDGGGVASAMATAREHVAAALAELRFLPPGPARRDLEELAVFIVAREF